MWMLVVQGWTLSTRFCLWNIEHVENNQSSSSWTLLFPLTSSDPWFAFCTVRAWGIGHASCIAEVCHCIISIVGDVYFWHWSSQIYYINGKGNESTRRHIIAAWAWLSEACNKAIGSQDRIQDDNEDEGEDSLLSSVENLSQHFHSLMDINL